MGHRCNTCRDSSPTFPGQDSLHLLCEKNAIKRIAYDNNSVLPTPSSTLVKHELGCGNSFRKRVDRNCEGKNRQFQFLSARNGSVFYIKDENYLKGGDYPLYQTGVEIDVSLRPRSDFGACPGPANLWPRIEYRMGKGGRRTPFQECEHPPSANHEEGEGRGSIAYIQVHGTI
ncbi:hypothetical protein CDAR_289681 [Caerostris darwini]|uniref:Uncharacterized protein n=1 Tax=Caerostris darwini TaxID=1538125 RepID=A0AAV4WX56_9ARAC|nr:hypothetical protein CDAR_289681 [Caerostris darwini]